MFGHPGGNWTQHVPVGQYVGSAAQFPKEHWLLFEQEVGFGIPVTQPPEGIVA
jgi:hypothetical protein